MHIFGTFAWYWSVLPTPRNDSHIGCITHRRLFLAQERTTVTELLHAPSLKSCAPKSPTTCGVYNFVICMDGALLMLANEPLFYQFDCEKSPQMVSPIMILCFQLWIQETLCMHAGLSKTFTRPRFVSIQRLAEAFRARCLLILI